MDLGTRGREESVKKYALGGLQFSLQERSDFESVRPDFVDIWRKLLHLILLFSHLTEKDEKSIDADMFCS